MLIWRARDAPEPTARSGPALRVIANAVRRFNGKQIIRARTIARQIGGPSLATLCRCGAQKSALRAFTAQSESVLRGTDRLGERSS